MRLTSLVAPWIAVSLGLSASACGGSEAASPGGGTDAGGADVVSGDSAAVSEAGEDASAPWVAVPLYSCVGDVYTTPVTIGGSQVFNAIIDTGSTTFGVAATTCTDCDVTPEYTPGTTATDEKQTASSQYGLGSWSGEIYQDTLTIGAEPALPVKFASITTQSMFFQTAQCDSKVKSYQAILGLGPTAVALPGTNGYFDDLVSAQHVPDVFGLQLCSTGGTLWLGGWDASATTAAPQYTPMVTTGIDADYYAVTLSSITVNGTSVPVGSGKSGLAAVSFVDTGTSIFVLAQTPFTAVTNAIKASAGFTSIFGATSTLLENPGSCAEVTKTPAEIDAALPALTLVFGSSPGISVQAAPSESYLTTGGSNEWCSSIATDQEIPVAGILGAPVLRSNVVIIDRANKQVGFAPHTPCN